MNPSKSRFLRVISFVKSFKPDDVSSAVLGSARSAPGSAYDLSSTGNSPETADTPSTRRAAAARRRCAKRRCLQPKASGWEGKHVGSFDFILDCVSAAHDVNPYLALLRRDGTYCTVGVPAEPMQISAFAVVGGRKRISGSATGGIKETQEMLDFCGEHGIVSSIEMTRYEDLEAAWNRVVRGDVKYRFVLDNRSL